MAYPESLSVSNPGAESGTSFWTNADGTIVSIASGGGNSPRTGSLMFRGGPNLTHEAYQDVAIPPADYTEVDSGLIKVELSAYHAGYDPDGDSGALALSFYDGSSILIGNKIISDYWDDPAGMWTLRSIKTWVPALARTIRIAMLGQRAGGTNLDSYWDDITLVLTKPTPGAAYGVSGCDLWLKGETITEVEDDPISTWPDSSGLGNDLTGTGTARPISKPESTLDLNNLPAAYADGNNDIMGLADSLQYGGKRGLTIFAVIHHAQEEPIPDSGFDSDAPIVSNSTSGRRGFRFALLTDDDHAMPYFMIGSGLDTNKSIQADTINGFDLPGIFRARFDGVESFMELAINKEQIELDESGIPAMIGENGPGVTIFGEDWTTNHPRFIGKIAEILVYGKTLSDEDVQTIESALLEKYNFYQFTLIETSPDIDAHQGITFDGTNYYLSHTDEIKRLNASWVQQDINSSPFSGLPGPPTHLGDVAYYNGKLYIGVSGGDYPMIAIYNANDLSLFGYVDISDYEYFTSSLCIDQETGIAYLISYAELSGWNQIIKLDANDNLSYLGVINLSRTVPWAQGIAKKGRKLFVSCGSDPSVPLGKLDDALLYEIDSITGEVRIVFHRLIDHTVANADSEGLDFIGNYLLWLLDFGSAEMVSVYDLSPAPAAEEPEPEPEVIPTWDPGETFIRPTSGRYLVPVSVTPVIGSLPEKHMAALAIRHPDRFYYPLIKSHGNLQRSITAPVGFVRSGDMTLRILDVNNEIRQDWSFKTLRKALVDMRIGKEDESFAGFDILTKRIAGVLQQTGDGELSLPLEETTFDLFEQPIESLMDETDFPNLPDNLTANFAPIIFGDVFAAGGAIHCPLVDTENFSYLVARHRCKDVQVYRRAEGEDVYTLVTTGYSITTDYVLGSGYATLIVFDSDQESADIRANVSGTYDLDTGNPTNTNFADAILWVLNEMGIPDDPDNIDQTSFETVRNAINGITCAGAITEAITWGEFITRLQRSSNIDFYHDRLNRAVVKYTTQGATSTVTIDDTTGIFRGSVRQSMADPVYNRLPYNYAPNYAAGSWTANKYDNTEDQLAMGEVVKDEVLNMWFIRDAGDAQTVIINRSQYMTLDSKRIEAEVPLPDFLTAIDLADIVAFNHFGGMKQGGFVGEQFKLTDISADVDQLRLYLRGIARSIPPTEITDPIIWRSCPTAVCPVLGETWLVTTISSGYDEWDLGSEEPIDALYIIKYSWTYEKFYLVYLEIGDEIIEAPEWNEPDIALKNDGGNITVLVLTSANDNHIEVRVFNGGTLLYTYDPEYESEFDPNFYRGNPLTPSNLLIDSDGNIHITVLKETGYLYDLKSEDNGSTWSAYLITDQVTENTFQAWIAEDPIDGRLWCLTRSYIGTPSALWAVELKYSTDGGENWTLKTDDINDFDDNKIFGFIPWNGDLVVLAGDQAATTEAYGLKIYKSSDLGATWSSSQVVAAGSPPTNRLEAADLVDDGQYLIAVLTFWNSPNYTSRVYRSTDGSTWSLMQSYP